jgi:hypothetical protein
MAERISENINSAGQEAGEGTSAERTLDELCAAKGAVVVGPESAAGRAAGSSQTMNRDIEGFRTTPFDKIRARMREGRARALILAYYRHRTRPRLIKLLVFAGVPEAESILSRLGACTRYSPCRMYTCPNCGPKLKARAKDDALNRIVNRLGRFPKGSEVSFVTLIGPTVELDRVEAATGLTKFKRQIVKFQQRHAPSTSWYGFFDVSLAGVLHWHGVVLHAEVTRNELEARLEVTFPEEDRVVIRPWKRSQSLAENLQGVFNYSLVADRHAKVFVLSDGPDRHLKLVHGPDSALL